MSTKLTLSFSDKDLIEEAMQYAKEQDSSLSRIIEDYLKSLITSSKGRTSKVLEISPEV